MLLFVILHQWKCDLTDHQSGHGEFIKGVWISDKSIPGRTFYFETYLPTEHKSHNLIELKNGFERLGMDKEDEYFWKTVKEREIEEISSDFGDK
jgi:hypothetical protein